jgi:replication-associated recombination protein RarA
MLTSEDIGTIINKALKDADRGLCKLNLVLEADAFNYLVSIADGDARVALNNLEVAGSLIKMALLLRNIYRRNSKGRSFTSPAGGAMKKS